MTPAVDPPPDWRARALEAEARLREAEDTLDAIRSGDVDAVVVSGAGSTQVYTLENADRPYRVLIEQMQEGAVTVTGEGVILYCNERLAALVGRTREQVVGAPLATLIALEGETLVRNLLKARGGGAKAEAMLSGPGGADVPVHLSFVELTEGDGGGRMLCGIVTDLSEQKLHTAELSAANDRLTDEIAERERVEDALRQAQKMEAIGQLTGGVAHDFNNLLTIIRSSADLLRRRELTEEKRRRYVDAISDTADRAAKLTAQLLAFARRQALKPEAFEAGARVAAVAEMLRTLVGGRIRLEIRDESVDAWILADPNQFEIALVNMVVNARDAMDGEGHLTISVGHGAPAGSGGESMISVAIADTGCGIPPDRIDRIFEPFYTSKEVGKGTGLGLSQVYGFAKQSGGEVGVSSEVGRGTTFTLYLPAYALPEGSPADRTVSAAAQASPGARVLVVEDNVEVGEFSTTLLRDLGYVTVLATDAGQALALLAAQPHAFDIVFSDVIMPGMSGVELAERLRRDHPHLRVVLTSGYSQVLAQEGTHGLRLLQKPYSVEELSRTLREALEA